MKKINNLISVLFLAIIASLISCTVGPQKIKIGEDVCSFCRMSIADNRFGAEIVTKKGKIYKFDDTHCLTGFIKTNTINNQEIKNTYLVDFNEPHDLIAFGQALLLKSGQRRSPMGGNIAAFSSQNQLNIATRKLSGIQVTLEGILK